MRTRYDELIAAIRAACPDGPAPPAMDDYLATVRHRADRVTDGDVERLKVAGFSEDEIFEQTVAVAVAAGLERLEAGLGALR